MCTSSDGDVFKAAVELCFLFLLLQNSLILSGLSWEDLLHPLYQKYKNHITWGDQDLLNIIFHYNPGAVPSYWFMPTEMMENKSSIHFITRLTNPAAISHHDSNHNSACRRQQSVPAAATRCGL